MLKQMLDRFPGIGCAYMDGAGKVNTEYYGADENAIFSAASIKIVISRKIIVEKDKK